MLSHLPEGFPGCKVIPLTIWRCCERPWRQLPPIANTFDGSSEVWSLVFGLRIWCVRIYDWWLHWKGICMDLFMLKELWCRGKTHRFSWKLKHTKTPSKASPFNLNVAVVRCSCATSTMRQIPGTMSMCKFDTEVVRSGRWAADPLLLRSVWLVSSFNADGGSWEKKKSSSLLFIWVFPKIMGKPPNHPILLGFSIINHPFWVPLFLETPICQTIRSIFQRPHEFIGLPPSLILRRGPWRLESGVAEQGDHRFGDV